MRLLDRVAQSVEPVLVQGDDQRVLQLPGAAAAAGAVRGCSTRYILDGDVAELCTYIAFDRDGALASSLDILRAPVSQLWLEFDNCERADALVQFGLSLPGASLHQRIGLLLEGRSDRAGAVRFFWEDPAHGPEQAPVWAEFDLDAPGLAEGSDEVNHFGISAANVPQLSPLYDRVRFHVEPAWRDYYRRAAGHEYQDVMRRIIAPLCGDLPMVFALSLLLMTKTALQERPSDLSKLNRSRRARGRQGLLEHTLLTVNLAAASAQYGRSEQDARAPSRLHVVRGHLVRRAGAVFWRKPHMRGRAEQGMVSSRTIELRLSGARSSIRR